MQCIHCMQERGHAGGHRIRVSPAARADRLRGVPGGRPAPRGIAGRGSRRQPNPGARSAATAGERRPGSRLRPGRHRHRHVDAGTAARPRRQGSARGADGRAGGGPSARGLTRACSRWPTSKPRPGSSSRSPPRATWNRRPTSTDGSTWASPSWQAIPSRCRSSTGSGTSSRCPPAPPSPPPSGPTPLPPSTANYSRRSTRG